jgi:hypothetical protein
MTIKVGTNQTNQTESPTPIEPEATTPPKAEEAKPSAAEARKAHDEMGWGDRIINNVDRYVDLVGDVAREGTNAGTVANGLDIVVDMGQEIPLIGSLPFVQAADDLTDVMVDAHEKMVATGKTPLELVGDIPGAAERVANRTNEHLTNLFGDDAPQLATSLDQVSWDATLEMLEPSNWGKAASGAVIYTAEVLRENDDNIAFLKNSNVGKQAVDVLEMAGTGLTGTLAAIWPPSALLLATKGGGMGERLVTFTKETVDVFTNPEKLHDLVKVANGPSKEMVLDMKPGDLLTSEMSLEVELVAGGGGEAEAKSKNTLRKMENGDFELTVQMNGAGAAAAGLSKAGKLTAKGDLGFEAKYIIQDPETAARIMRQDRSAMLLQLARDGKMEGIEPVALKTSYEGSVNAAADKHLGTDAGGLLSLDSVKEEVEIGFKLSGSVAPAYTLENYIDTEDNSDLVTAMKVFDELAETGFGGNVSAEAKLTASKTDAKFTLEIAAAVSSKNVDASAKITVEIDIDEAARAMNMTKDTLYDALKNGTLDHNTWWEKLPKDVVQIKPEFKTVTFDTMMRAEAGPVSASVKKGQEKSYNAQEFLSFVLGQSASDRQISQIR